jgi:hypothetical protein
MTDVMGVADADPSDALDRNTALTTLAKSLMQRPAI